MALILGIETSCDETGVAIVKDGKKVVAEKLKSSVDLQKEFGGVVPELASRVHVEYINILINKALLEAGLKLNDIDAVAVANGPGLLGALLVGTMVTKTIGMVLGKKIVSVNHLEGHIYSAFLNYKNYEKLQGSISNIQSINKINFPILILIVSGGHTELILMSDYGVYREIGSTIDDAAGEAFDKAARILGLTYPGGPSVGKAAEQFLNINIQYPNINLPRPMINSDDYDFSFSGLKTALLYEVQKIRKEDDDKLSKEEVEMLAYEFQEAVTDVLVTKTKRAMRDLKINKLAVVGGVAANKRLREKLQEQINCEIIIPEFKYCTDNGVKIAVAGYYKYMKGEFTDWKDLEVNSNWELRSQT